MTPATELTSPMRTIGLLGGMSWESTALYYRLINEETRRRLGGLHSAPLLLASVDFAPVERLQAAGNWEALGALLADHAVRLEGAGAQLLVLCTNTMHRVADAIEAATTVPFLHLADATAQRVRSRGLETVGLLGTRYTMEQDFYRGRLERSGLRVLVPDDEGRERVHRVIYDELCRGMVREESREAFRRIVDDLVRSGAQGVIEGCTEIGLLLEDGDADVPLFDTAAIHAEVAVDRALQN